MFLNCYKASNGEVRPKIVVMKIHEKTEQKTSYKAEEIDSLDEELLPF